MVDRPAERPLALLWAVRCVWQMSSYRVRVVSTSLCQRLGLVEASFCAFALVAAACAGEAERARRDGREAARDAGPVLVFAPRHREFGTAFEALLARCAAESETLDIMLGPLRRSGRPLTARPDSTVLFSLPYGSNFEPVLRIDLRDFSVFPDGATIRRRLDESKGPGYIFPHTPRCAALAHRIFEAITYRRDHARNPPSNVKEAERLRRAANLETVFVENDVAFDYGHRVEPGGYRVDRIGHCTPEEDEIHIIIERHSEIIQHFRTRVDGLGRRYNTGRGACVDAVTGEPIDSWVDERPK